MANKDYDALVEALAPLILDRLLAGSTAAGEIEAVTSLDNIKALAAYRSVGGTEKTVEVPLDLLKGEDGSTPMFKVSGGYMQYRYADTDAWTNLVAMSTLKGDNGLTPYIKDGNWWIGTTDTGVQAEVNTSDLGDTVTHTNINSLDRPTITMPDDQEEPTSTVVKEVAFLDDIPEVTPHLLARVTEMLDIPSAAEFIAEQHLPAGKETRSIITLRALDTTEVTNDLTITCKIGFGSPSAVNFAGITAVDNGDGTFTHIPYVIKMTAEDGDTPSIITIPKECNNVDIFWFVASTPPAYKTSYWVDTSGVYHVFTAANTPINNFATSGNEDSTIIIEGVNVVKNQVYQLGFGNDYAATNIMTNDFVSNFINLINLDLSQLINVKTINFGSLRNLPRLSSLDISMIKPNWIGGNAIRTLASLTNLKLDLSSLTHTEAGVMHNMGSLSKIDLSTLGKLINVSDQLLSNCNKLTSIQLGSVDWSVKNVNGANVFVNVPNLDTSTLYADTQAVADAFKAKVPNVSNWTVVINETPTGA